MKKIIIAIDGFSSTGKSTVAKAVAKQLNYTYVDTGAMYRAVAFYALEKGYVSPSGCIDNQALAEDIQHIKIEFKFDENLGFSPIYLNGENIEDRIRSLKVSSLVSYVASIPEIRKRLVAIQQHIGENKGIVMDGRDIATVVFPNAELKIFMTASTEVRAKRRYNELVSKGENISLEQVERNITQRDDIDSNRSVSPLKKATDAIEIDNSFLSIEQQVEQITALAKEIILQKTSES